MRHINLNQKQLLLIGLVAALGIAVILNWRLSLAPTLSASSKAAVANASASSGTKSPSTSGAANSYFAAARLTRQQTNAQAEELLNSLTQLNTATPGDLQSIQSAVSAFKTTLAGEGTLEEMIKTKGFPDCVVFINNGITSVVVQPKAGNELTADDVQQIEDIVTQQAKVGPETIRIVVVK